MSEVLPQSEICDGVDNDCDGQVDEGCDCMDGQTRSCYAGPAGTEGIGICQSGSQTCMIGHWGACQGEILPSATLCNGEDNNCDGTIDDEQVCQCSLNLPSYSSVNAASGNLAHDQSLFSTKGARLAAGMTLYYNSKSMYTGPVGKKWTHTYDINLQPTYDGSVILSEGNGRGKLYTKSGNVYLSQPGDYSTLMKNADGAFVITWKDGLKYHFDQNGKIISMVDRNGNTVVFSYTNGNLTSVTDSAARTITFSYDTGNRVSAVISPNGGRYDFTYAADVFASVTAPDGGKWRYAYDADAFMVSKTDPNGNVTTYTYDGLHRQVTATNPQGQAKSMTYAPGEKTAVMTEADDGVWTYKYDTALGVLLQKTDPKGNITSYSYDQNKNLLTKTEPDGATTRYTYNGSGDMTSRADALGQITTYTYNEYGQITSIEDPQGGITAYEYDAKGNLTAVTEPTGATTNYSYDANGNIASVTNAAGQTTAFAYDQYNNVVSVTDPTGAVVKFTYDLNGNITTLTDANGFTTTYEYNSLNQLVRITDPNGNSTSFNYDKNGNQTSQTDANGNTTYFTYDFKGRLIQVKDALGNVTTYTYGGSGCASCGGGGDRLTAVTDARGNSTTYQYDQAGKLIKETDPLGYSVSYAYDTKGNLISKTDAAGHTVQFTYDASGRLMTKTYPDGTQEGFVYDAGGNLIDWQTPQEHIAFIYDLANRITAKAYRNLGRGIEYEYDAAGRKTAMIDAEGGRTAYTYDATGRIAKITDPSGNWVTYSYDAVGRRTGVSYSNSTATVYAYDTAGRLQSTLTTGPTGTISSYQYTYDKVGNRLSVKESNGNTTQFIYDKIYRLTAYDETRPDANKGTFEYDAVGNRVKMILARKYVKGDSRSFIYSYNSGNALLSIAEKGRHSPVDTLFSYDPNGNLSIRSEEQGRKTSITRYQYDYSNRLTEVRMPDVSTVTMQNLNDGYNRMSKHTAAGKTTYFHDGMGVLAEYDADGSRMVRYTLGSGVDEIIARKDEAGTYFYHYDGLGSVAAITGSAGKVVAKYDYEPFGRFKETAGSTIKNAYTFTGREWDEETGLYFYRARYMDPKVGRFISKDPLGFDGGDVNLYSYVQSNPIINIDPKGTEISLCYTPVDNPLFGYIANHASIMRPGGCTGLSDIAWGFHPTGSIMWSRGEVRAEGDRALSGTCAAAQDASMLECVDEECVCSKIRASKQNPPYYGVILYNCHSWTREIINSCQR